MRKRRDGRSRALAGVVGAACVAAILAVVLLATSAGGSSGGYQVRAVFDDAGNLIGGENVEIDGVKVGTVAAVEATPQAKAAVVLSISNPGFRSFRADASCTIRPQGLIGEKYVECLPTQAREEGAPLPPPLKRIPSGKEGAGEYLLPLENTHSPIDVDLLGDIQRLPERQRLTLILNELGAGLAGRGSDLRAVVQRANPALQELDKVLRILAGERHVLTKLAEDSERALVPFARVRGRVADFIAQANTVARATQRHDAALAQNLKDFPPFLEQLGPAVERLGHFAEETRPVFSNLGVAAPSIDTAFESLPSFSNSSTQFFQSLGRTSKVTGPAVVGTRGLLQRLKGLGSAGAPFSGNLATLLSSVRESGGLERLLDFIFLGAGASNGYDALGHFLRAEGVADAACLKYAVTLTAKASGCIRKLLNQGANEASASSEARASAASAHGSSSEPTGLIMARTLAVVKGETPAQAIAEYPGPESERELRALAAETGASKPSATSSSPSGAGAEGQAGSLLLNYLLGSEQG